jgi:hypothetical protein
MNHAIHHCGVKSVKSIVEIVKIFLRPWRGPPAACLHIFQLVLFRFDRNLVILPFFAI